MTAVVVANLLCALFYLVLSLLLAIHSERRPAALALIAACAATGLWALAVSLETGVGVQLGPSRGVLEVLRSGTWLAFLGLAYRAGLPEGASARRVLHWVLVPGGGICLGLIGLELYSGTLAARGAAEHLLLADICGHLLLVMAGLMLVEALLRHAEPESRWRVKYLCVGLGGLLAYDLFLYSEALLFRGIEPIIDASRGAVSAIAAPLIAVAAARNPTWSVQLNVARRAVFHSMALVVVGIYMLGLAAAGTAFQKMGGEWGRLLQAAFLFTALVLLAVLLLSRTLRSTLKLQLGRYLFTHRHDYREQWQSFAEALSSSDRDASLRDRALQAVANIVDSPRGGLWLRESDVFTLVAALRLPEAATDEPADGPFAQALYACHDRILELGARERGEDGAPWLPEWLCSWQAAWLVAPLVHRDTLTGFIVLARPLTHRRLDCEDEELLRLVARQVASYLAEEQTTRALEEARRFEEVSRSLAFIGHDLRNLANDLVIALANARRHIQDPEFQRDLLASMEDSVAGMQRLLDRLRSDASAPAASTSTDLAQLVGDSLRRRVTGNPEVRFDFDAADSLLVASEPDRLVAITGHLIRNATEATGPDGRVTVQLSRVGDQALFEVTDNGPGMSPECVREHLLHPFRSAKSTGLGLGLYECRELAREMGGRLVIDSEPGSGTTARLWLPLAEGEGGGTLRERRHVHE